MDLANYLELRDIEDELTSIKTLLKEQTIVLQNMSSQWHRIMARVKGELSSKERLIETEVKIASYKAETDKMLADCRTAQDAVCSVAIAQSLSG